MNQRSFWRFAFLWSALIFCLFAPIAGRADEEVAPVEKKKIVINGKTFKLRSVNGGGYGQSHNYTATGRADVAFIWDGQTVWSVDPTRSRILYKFSSKYRVLALSPDHSCALVETETGVAIMDVKTQELTFAFDDEIPPPNNAPRRPTITPALSSIKRYARWQFSPNGKFVFPLSRNSDDENYRFINVEKKLVLKLSLWRSECERDSTSVSGVCSSNGQSLILFARTKPKIVLPGQNGNSNGSFLNKIIRFNPNEGRSVVAESPFDVEQVFLMRAGKILCLLRSFEIEGNDLVVQRRIALIDKTTLQVIVKTNGPKNDRVFWAGFSPDGKSVYTLGQFDGLNIYNAKNLKFSANIKAGRTANAYSIGATFSQDGKSAFLTQPYVGTVTVLDVATRKISSTITVGQGVAGVLPIGDECFVITTLLPYE